MATLNLAPVDDAWERVAALGRIARGLLAMRIVACLLVTLWFMLYPHRVVAVAALLALSVGLLVFLLRWSTIGVVLSTHPAVLALDLAVGFFVVTQSAPPDPSLVVVGTGALLCGVCLGGRGAAFFAPTIVASWWFIYVGVAPENPSTGELFNALVIVPGMLAGAIVAGVVVRRETLAAAEQARERRSQVRAAGIAEERARLAREMHDSLIKSLHGVALLADALPRWIEVKPERAKEHARTIAEMINRSSKDSRDLIVAMRRAPSHATLGAMVEGVADRWTSSTGRRATVRVDGAPALPTESAYELSAILNEALENIGRHTPTTASADIVLCDEDAWVELRISDDGGAAGRAQTDELAQEGHFGVRGMRERAARVGGTLAIDVRPGAGVTVTARIPAVMDDDLFDEV